MDHQVHLVDALQSHQELRETLLVAAEALMKIETRLVL